MSSALARIALLPLMLIVPMAFAADDATRWLERMSQAAHSLNYVGTFVYMQQGRLESMQLVHSVDEQGEHERLVSLSGPNREVIREHGQVTCYLPEKDALVANHPVSPLSFPVNLPTHWDQLRNVYEFKVLGTSRVAGMEAQHIAIVPRDKLRYGQNYWISTDSGLLLRTDVVDEQGEVVEQLEFIELTLLDKVPPPMLEPEAGSHAVELLPNSPAAEVKSRSPLHWQVNRLPDGFELELQRQHAITEDGVVVDHLVYSDGLASVSVFIEPRRDKDDEGSSTSRRGSVSIYTRVLAQQRLTVLGEVPLATVMQIGKSIEPLGQ